LRDPQVLALAAKIGYRVEAWPEFPRTFPGGLRLTLRDGRTLERREPINRGHPDNPIATTDVQAKFRDNAKRALPAERLAAIIAVVEHLEELPSIAELMALCVAR